MTTRISGLSSGIDVDSMVTQLMKAERMRILDPLTKKKQLLQWKRDDYREVNTKLLALRKATFDIKLQGSFSAKTVTSGNEAVLTATAGTSAVTGNYSINVDSLASGVNKASTAKLDSSTTKTTLKDQFAGIADTVTFALEGYADGEIKSQSFSFTSSQSIYDVVDTINSADIGIKASYDANVDRIFLNTTETGANSRIHATADTQNFLTATLKLNLTVDGTDVVAADKGKDAQVDFNGANDLTFSSNQFTISGINFNLKGTGSTSLTVNNNIDAAVDKIKAFIDAYNTAVDYMGTKMSEEYDSDYGPLTDDQKEEMTDTQIEKWETKAKTGLLRSDTLLMGVYNNIRSASITTVSGLTTGNKYTSLSTIGITTQSYTDNGKLYIDEDKLRAALSQDPDGVMELFTKSGDTSSTKGIGARLYDIVNNSMTQITNEAGSSSSLYDTSFIGRELIETADGIDQAEDRLTDLEDRYYQQYTAMETALNKLQSQSQWLMQQLGLSSSSSSK